MVHILWLINLHVGLVHVWIFEIKGQMLIGKLEKIWHVLSRIEVPVAGTTETAHFSLLIKYKVTVGVAPRLLGEIVELDLTKLRILNHFLILMAVNCNHFRGKCCMR